MSEQEQGAETGSAEPVKSGGIGRMLLQGVGIFVIVVAANLVSGMFTHESPAAGAGGDASQGVDAVATEADLPPPIYASLGDPMVVNFNDNGQLRFLQVSVDVMAREHDAIDNVGKNLPILRNNLLLMFGNFDYKFLASLEGKEKMRSDALAEVRSVLARITGEPGIEDLYFTSFVIQ